MFELASVAIAAIKKRPMIACRAIVFLATVLTPAACGFCGGVQSQVEGSGNLNTETREVGSFTRIATNTAIAEAGTDLAFQAGMADATILTPESWPRFGLLWQSYFMHAQTTHHLFKMGVIQEDHYHTDIGITAAILRAPGVNQWWEIAGRHQITPEVAEVLESVPPGVVFSWDGQRGFVHLGS